jgi:hypothetical protein
MKIIISSLWIVIAVYVSSSPIFSQQKSTDPIEEIMDRLGGIKIEARDPRIPQAVKPLFTTLKHQLRDLIARTINDQTIHWKTPNDLASHVISSLKKRGIVVGGSKDEPAALEEEEGWQYSYDDIRRISIKAVNNHADLLVAMTTLWVMCGEDTSFYLFRRTKDEWRLILAQEALDYDEISGAQAELNYAISPSDNQGDFFVATANINPWCTSNWQSLRYRVVRPGRTPYEPEVLLKKTDTIYIGVDPPLFKLSAEQTQLRLDFHGDWSTNLGISHQFAEYHVDRKQVSLIRRGTIKE